MNEYEAGLRYQQATAQTAIAEMNAGISAACTVLAELEGEVPDQSEQRPREQLVADINAYAQKNGDRFLALADALSRVMVWSSYATKAAGALIASSPALAAGSNDEDIQIARRRVEVMLAKESERAAIMMRDIAKKTGLRK